jgi:hypothetical protein
MTTLADLSAAELADLYRQVGDTMYNPGFNYDAHIQGNTVNGVFVPPVHIPPSASENPVTPNLPVIPGGGAGGQGTGSTPVSTIAGLSPQELEALYRQVGDAMYAPGFNYQAHILGNTVNGVFIPPVFIPTNTASLLQVPAAGTAAYLALLAETGGASANPGFNYAAHIAATVSQSRTDLSYDDVMRLIVETGKTDYTGFDVVAYRQSTGSTVGLGNIYANNDSARIAATYIESQVLVPMPAVGSPEYIRLSQETGGASERPGFNYLAHIAAVTSQNILTSLSYAEVVTLVAETGMTRFDNFDLDAYRIQKAEANQILGRFTSFSTNTNAELPPQGSPAYQQILEDTGLDNLTGFDYQSYLIGLQQARIAALTVQGTSGNDLLLEQENANKDVFVGGDGHDVIEALNGRNVLVGGSGNDELRGGDSIDIATYKASSAEVRIQFQENGLITLIAEASGEGTDILSNVERLSFEDTSVALDVGQFQNAGGVFRLFEAAFDRAPKAVGQGYWLNKLDNGSSLVDIANEFTKTEEFQRVYGNSSPDYEFYVREMFQHVLGRDPRQAGLEYWTAKLKNGESHGSILAGIAESDENVANVAALIANGIQYQEQG